MDECNNTRMWEILKDVGADLVSALRLLKPKNEGQKTVFKLLNTITTKKNGTGKIYSSPVPFLSVRLLSYVKC